MRPVLLSTAAFVLGIFALAACNSKELQVSQTNLATPTNSPSTTNPSDSARRITAEELHTIWEKGNVLIIDTRTEPAFKESHIKGAILIPAGEVGAKFDELPRDKMIVTYCT